MVGIVLAFCSTPLVARDWTSVFYIYGCLGIVWTAFFWRFTASHPQKHAGIGTPELQLLLAEHGSRAVLQLDTEEEEGTELTAVSSHSGTAVAPGGDGVAAGGAKPLTACALATNLPFIAIVVGHCTFNYGYYVMLFWLPLYFVHLGASLDQLAAFAVLPYFLMWFLDVSWGWAADHAIKEGWASIVAVRKVSQTLSLAVPAACLMVLGALGEGGTSAAGSMALVTIAIVFGATSHSGYWANILDVGPNHAGLLSGVSNTFAQLPGIVGNLVTGYTLGSAGWSAVFIQVACIQMVGMVFYLCFASAHVQFD